MRMSNVARYLAMLSYPYHEVEVCISRMIDLKQKMFVAGDVFDGVFLCYPFSHEDLIESVSEGFF